MHHCYICRLLYGSIEERNRCVAYHGNVRYRRPLVVLEKPKLTWRQVKEEAQKIYGTPRTV